MELSDEQQRAVRWQWLLVVGTMILCLLVTVIDSLLGRYTRELVLLQGGPFSLFGCAGLGLANLAIGILSVRYQVTIIGRRLKLSETVEGSRAVKSGWLSIIGGTALIGIGLVWSFEREAGLLVFLGCLLFVLTMLPVIIYGLHRVLGRRDTWN